MSSADVGRRLKALTFAHRPAVELVVSLGMVTAAVRQGQMWDAAFAQAIEPGEHGAWPSLDQLAEALEALAAQGATQWLAGSPLRVLVAEAWLRTATALWSPALLAPATCASWQMGALNAAGWATESDESLIGSNAPAPARQIVLAWPAPLRQAIERFAAACMLDLVEMHPLALSVSMRAAPDGADAVAIVDQNGWTCVVLGSGGVPIDVQSRWAGDPAADVHAHMKRSQWRQAEAHDPQGQQRLSVIDLSGGMSADTGARQHALLKQATALRRRPGALDAAGRTRRLLGGPRWAAAALAAVAMATWHAGSTSASWQRAEVALAEQRDAVALTAAGGAAPETKTARTRREAIEAALLQLKAPITTVLAETRPPRDIAIQVVSVAIDARPHATAASPRPLRVRAEARSAMDMHRYAGFLATRPHIASAQLLSHEAVDEGAGQVFRFEVEAVWRE